MNQSDWFSLEEIETQQLVTQQSVTQKPKTQTKHQEKIDISNILKDYSPQIFESNLTKYLVQASTLQDDKKQINEKSKVLILIEERDENGELINKQQTNNQKLRISLASSTPMIQGLRKAILSMKEGEIAWFKISNNLLCTSKEIESGLIVDNRVKYYKIQIFDVIQPTGLLDISQIENRLIQLKKFREDGNQFYKKQQYDSALLRYQRGLNFLEKWPKKFENDSEANQVKKESFITLSNNSAQCYIKLFKYKEAVNILESIIDLVRGKEYEVKTYYRLAFCLAELNNDIRLTQIVKQIQYLKDLSIEEQMLFRNLINC